MTRNAAHQGNTFTSYLTGRLNKSKKEAALHPTWTTGGHVAEAPVVPPTVERTPLFGTGKGRAAKLPGQLRSERHRCGGGSAGRASRERHLGGNAVCAHSCGIWLRARPARCHALGRGASSRQWVRRQSLDGCMFGHPGVKVHFCKDRFLK